MEQVARNIRELLHSNGLRATPQRITIATVVTQPKHHLTADQVYKQSRRHLSSLSRATVYNTLNTMVKKNVICELTLEDGKTLYDNNVSAHHHFICEDTGELIDVPRNLVKELELAKLNRTFDVQQYTIMFRGKLRKKGDT